jgi:thiol-disulfide isomerase/thioredoxin
MATTKPKPRKSAVAAARKKEPPWLWIGVAALVLVLALAAVVSSGGSDDGDKQSAAGLEETRPVTVTGPALPELPTSGADPDVGKEIPDVNGQSFDGTPINITKDGKPKLVLFVAHWCPHCQNEVPLLADYLKSNPLQGVDLYTVSTGVVKARGNHPPSAWLEKEGWTAPTLADSDDGKAATAFGLSSFPYFVAVDASGKVVERTVGEISTDEFAALAAKARGGR